VGHSRNRNESDFGRLKKSAQCSGHRAQVDPLGTSTWFGIVDGAADSQIAEVRAREVTGVFEVENGLSWLDRRHLGASRTGPATIRSR
jgi:hypothetical protein